MSHLRHWIVKRALAVVGAFFLFWGTGYGVRGTGYGVRGTGYGVRGTGYGVRCTGVASRLY